MKKFKKLTAIVLISGLFLPSCLLSAEKPTALFLVNAEPGMRLYSMGTIFSSGRFEDAFYNPWALGLVTVPGVSLSHWPGVISRSQYNFFGFIVPTKKAGAFSLNYLSYDVGEELLYELDGTPRSVKLEEDKMLSAGYGFALSETLFAGIQAKYLSSTLAADYTAAAYLGDAGIMYHSADARHTLGASVKNYGTSITYFKTAETLPAQMAAGYTYNGNRLTIGAGYYTLLAGSLSGLSAGMEYKPPVRFISLRAGVKTAAATMKYFGGLGLNFGRMDIDVGSQFAASKDIANDMPIIFSLNWFFGGRDEESLSKVYAARGMKTRADEVLSRQQDDIVQEKNQYFRDNDSFRTNEFYQVDDDWYRKIDLK